MQSFCAHLTVNQSQVCAGRELSPDTEAWLFLRVCSGNGYLLDGIGHSELEPGDLVIVPAAANVSLRASQLGDMRLCQFGIRAEQLVGFFTAGERQRLEAVTANGRHRAHAIKREDPLAQQHAKLCDLQQCEPGVVLRSEMLLLAVRALREVLVQSTPTESRTGGPEQKFAELTAKVPESELLSSSTQELARECGCTERHLRRLFAGHFGVSLKQRQIEWRIEQAKKLLLETDDKVIDIASRCGFRSLGQFNLTFKRIAQMTPSAWREQFAVTNAKHKRQHPALCPRQIRPKPARQA